MVTIREARPGDEDALFALVGQLRRTRFPPVRDGVRHDPRVLLRGGAAERSCSRSRKARMERRRATP